MNFTNAEKTDMVLVYGEARGNAALARRLFRERWPYRRLPNERTFENVVRHLREFGSFEMNTTDIGRQRKNETLEVEEVILQEIENRPEISTRRLAAEVGVSHFLVWRTLKEQGLHPFHVQKVQALLPTDFPRRVQFSEWIVNKHLENPDFITRVLATDEATFSRNGVFNSRNSHIWSDENPHAIRENHFQQTFSINVWIGIVGGHLVGPHILPKPTTGAIYLDFLENVLPGLLENIPLNVRQELWYLHDGAPIHYARQVTTWMNERFPDCWIGRNGPILWPPRSPDLNPCDFFCGVT